MDVTNEGGVRFVLTLLNDCKGRPFVCVTHEERARVDCLLASVLVLCTLVHGWVSARGTDPRDLVLELEVVVRDLWWPTGPGSNAPSSRGTSADMIPAVSRRSFNDRSGERRFPFNADVQQTMISIVNCSESQKQGKTLLNCRQNQKEHTQLQEESVTHDAGAREPWSRGTRSIRHTLRIASTRTRPRCTVACRPHTSAASGGSQD